MLAAQIVWVLTDDQDIELGGLTPMKKSRELLGAQGAVGEAFYVNTPIVRPLVAAATSRRQPPRRRASSPVHHR